MNIHAYFMSFQPHMCPQQAVHPATSRLIECIYRPNGLNLATPRSDTLDTLVLRLDSRFHEDRVSEDKDS